MNTIVKSSNGITLVPMETRLLSERKIFVEGEINEELALAFTKQLMVLTAEDEKKPISIMINSSGGTINDGLLMYDVIQSIDTPLKMYCIGKAYSMAAVLFASGKKGSRFMMENSEVLLHEPLLGKQIGGNSSSIKSISEGLLEIKAKINEILGKHTGRSTEEIDAAMSYDHFFKAEEAIEFGLCDKVVGFRDMM